MQDLRGLMHKAQTLTIDPSEDNVNVFLEAYEAFPEPTTEIEKLMMQVLQDYAIVELYMQPECEHSQEEQDNG